MITSAEPTQMCLFKQMVSALLRLSELVLKKCLFENCTFGSFFFFNSVCVEGRNG